jgi:tight adherence protein B
MFNVLSESPGLVGIMVLVALLLLFEGVYLSWRSYRGEAAQRISRRLGAYREHDNGHGLLLQRAPSRLSALDGWLTRWRGHTAIMMWLEQSGSSWSLARLVATSICTAAAGLLVMVMLLHQPVWIGSLVALLFSALPPIWIALRRSRRLKLIERQLPGALDLMVRAMRAGHAFSSALQMAGTEMDEPIAGELRLAHDEVNFGVPLESALFNLEQRVPLMDLRYFVVAVMVQREAGGNLTEVLANLSRLIRERLKLLMRVRVLTSEGRLSAWILSLMPFMLFGLIATMNPKFMEPLWTDPIGISLVRIMLAMMLLGVLWLRRTTHVRV